MYGPNVGRLDGSASHGGFFLHGEFSALRCLAQTFCGLLSDTENAISPARLGLKTTKVGRNPNLFPEVHRLRMFAMAKLRRREGKMRDLVDCIQMNKILGMVSWIFLLSVVALHYG
jgi:hypothetical protein